MCFKKIIGGENEIVNIFNLIYTREIIWLTFSIFHIKTLSEIV